MQKPRVRFREFLLLTTMASLVIAAFAIRERTAYHEFATDHVLLAHRARLSVRSVTDAIKAAKRKMEMNPPISRDWSARCDLRLMPLANDRGVIPTGGKNLIIVTDMYGVLHFRMFDGDGKIVVEHSEGSHPRIEDFKKQLVRLWPPHELTGIEKGRLITAITFFVNDYRTSLEADVKRLEAMHTGAVAKAEHHERLARRP